MKIAWLICKRGMEANQAANQGNAEHLETLAFRCQKCPYRSSTVELLEGHRVNMGHSDESEETSFDRWRQKLAILTTNANDFCVATADLVEKIQAERGNSGGQPYVICMANLIKFYCEIVDSIAPEEILISTGEIFNAAVVNQPQVDTEILSNQSYPEETQISRGSQHNRIAVGTGLDGRISSNEEIVEKLLRGAKIHKSPVVVVRGKFGSFQCHSAVKKSARKRLEFNLIPIGSNSTEVQPGRSQNESELDAIEDSREEPPILPAENNSESIQLGTDHSAENHQKEPRRKEMRKTPAVLMGENVVLKSRPSDKRSRLISMPNSAETVDLTAEPIEAKRRKIDSTPTGTARRGAIRQAKLPAGTTGLQTDADVTVGSVAVGKTDSSERRKRQSSESQGGDVGLSSISFLSDRLANSSPSELLPEVTRVMRVETEDFQTQLDGHRLIDRYSAGQLDSLDSTLRRELVEVLSSGFKRHFRDDIFALRFCRLLRKIDVVQTKVDFSAVDSLMEIICGQIDYSARTKNLAKICLKEIVVMSVLNKGCLTGHHTSLKTSLNQLLGKISRSIGELGESEYDRIVEINWNCLAMICCHSALNRKNFVLAGGISLFRQCYEKYPKRRNLTLEMICLVKTLSAEKFPRDHLVSSGSLAILWEIWRGAKRGGWLSFYIVLIFTNFTSNFFSPVKWPSGSPTREKVEKKLRRFNLREMMAHLETKSKAHKDRIRKEFPMSTKLDKPTRPLFK